MNDLKAIEASFDTALVRYLELSNALIGELKYLFENHENDQSQNWRRTFVRASWSLVDGDIYALREMCCAVAPLRSDVIRKTDEDLLNSDRQETGDKIKGILRLAVKLFDLRIVLNFGDSHWAVVRDAVKKRHDVVHPKSAAAIFIDDDEWKKQKGAITWFMSTFNSLVLALQERYQ